MKTRTCSVRSIVSRVLSLLVLTAALTAGLLSFQGPLMGGEMKTVSIEFSDPLTPERELMERWRDYNPTGYDVSDETFRLFVPDGYSSEVPHGVLVWVSPNAHGNIPDRYMDVLEQRRLLAISAKNSGNDRTGVHRFLMAVDGARYLKRTYTVDEERVYVSGLSGGGRVASMVSVVYPDLFTGGAYMNGSDYYRDVRTGDGGHWDGFYPDLPKQFRNRVKQNRHAFITASSDFNKNQTKRNYQAAKREGWKHVTYVEQPDHGHAPVGTKWFKKAIKGLDKPLHQRATAWWKANAEKKNGSNGNVVERWRTLRKVWLHGFDADFAEKARNRMKTLRPRVDQKIQATLNSILSGQSNNSGNTSREQKLRRFVRRWEGFSVTDKARAELRKIARQQLARLENQQKVPVSDIFALHEKWIDVDVKIAERIVALYEKQASKVLSKLDSREPGDGLLKDLKRFRKNWPRTEAAEEALDQMDEILSGIIERIQKQPETPEANKTLMDIVIQFPDTETAGRATELLKKRNLMDALKQRRIRMRR